MTVQRLLGYCFRGMVQLAAVAAFFLVSYTPMAHAQAAGAASVQGTVADLTGALIPNATVTLIDNATQVQRTVKSDGNGLYSFPNVPVGTYTLSASESGFQKFVQSNIVLEVGSSISINVKMQVGAASQQVEVKSESLALQTEDATFKQTIDQNAVTEMPLNGRQMTNLITLSGGSAPAPGGDFTGSKFSYQAISISIAGGMGNTTMWRLDGGDNSDYMGNANLPFPFPDAVSQFSVESTALSAQNGMHPGGMVNVVTRSGTNQYHGSAFEFIRNNFIDATNFYATAKDSLHQNQYGGTFGGPIIRDKLFAFAGYQRTQTHQASSNTEATVPTAANLQGDFSVTAGPGCGAASDLKDPMTGVDLVDDKYPSPPTYNPQSLALQKYLPQDVASFDPNGCGFVSYAIPSQTTDNEFVTRVDYTINPKNHLYGRYFIDGYQNPAFFSPSNILITTATGVIQRVQSFTLDWAYAISARSVNSANVTLLRRTDDRGYSPKDINANTLGVTVYQLAPFGLQLSTSGFTMGGGGNSKAHFNDNTLAFDDDVTMLRGKWQIVFGGEWVQNELNDFNVFEGNGNFGFSSKFSAYGPTGTQAPGAPTELGDGALDFLMGAMNTFAQSNPQQNALRAPIPSLYVQGTYHAKGRLTLEGGLRWSPDFMPTDVFNRGSVFSMSGFLANQFSTVYPNAPAGSLFYGDRGVPRQFTQNSPFLFSPNVGGAYDLFGTGKTVLRAGVELVYDNASFWTGEDMAQNAPFSSAASQAQTATSGPLSFSAPWTVGQTTTSPFPQPGIPTPANALFPKQSQTIVFPTKFLQTYTEQWTASVQHQLGRGWQLQADYIGSHTVHAPMGTPFDQAVYIPGTWTTATTGCGTIATTGPAATTGVPGAPCSTISNQASRFQLTMLNPAQGNKYKGGAGSVYINDNAMSNYNGLVVSVQHRLSSTFSFLGNWTWSKCLNITDAAGDQDSVTFENANNPGMDYGPCGSDFRDIENATVVATSHFSSLSRFNSLLVNNWEIAPLFHIVSGGPFTVTSGQDNSFTDIGNDRPNQISGVPIHLHTNLRSGTGAANRAWLNRAAFTQIPSTAFGTYGNISRNSFRGPSSLQFDGQVSRIFPIRESLRMDFRLEAFNVLNHPDFGNPTSSLNSSTFGQISKQTNAARVFQGSLKFLF